MTNLIITIALTIFGEASGESYTGKLAVASVIYHRGRGDPSAMAAACVAPKQFSCWNAGKPKVPNDYPSRLAWKHCKEIAEEMVAGTLRPIIDATHFHSGPAPWWASDMRPVRMIGRLMFYKEAR